MRRPRSRYMVRDWRDELQAGDVLYEGGRASSPRVVRRASYREGFLSAVTLAIRHCSWTGRPYTVIGRSDLRSRGFIPTPFRVDPPRTKLERELQRNIDNRDIRSLSCCAVREVL